MKKYILIFFILILLLIVFYYGNKLYIIQSKAYIHSVNYDNTYIFCTPSKAKGNCQEMIRCTFVILDSAGLPLSGRICHLNAPSSVVVNNIKSESDSEGLCVFDLTSCTSGYYTLQPFIDQKQLDKTIKLFYD